MGLKKPVIITGVCMVGLAMALSACGSTTSTTADTAETTKETAAADTTNAKTEETQEYTVTIDGARVEQDYDGANAVVITYTFTNNSSDAQSFMLATSEDVYQNGVELDSAYISGLDSSASMNKVKPGSSTTIEKAYALQDMSPVDVEIYELFSLDKVLLAEKQFTLE
jgi:hypothetical protein